MPTPTEAIISAAGGDFFLIIFGLLFIFVLSLCGYLVYKMPIEWEKSQARISKEWEASTDRIVAKICDVITQQKEIREGQRALEKCYKEHDDQAKDIKTDLHDVSITLKNRPCINGKG